MKYLQIYDHNGNLTKEFLVYVDGQDFSWVAAQPEAIWLGTIKLATEPSKQPVKPTPEPEPEEMEITCGEYTERLQVAADRRREQLEDGAAVEELQAQQEAVAEKEAKEIEAFESEVKHEPEKRMHKGRRKPRAKSPDGFEGTETLPE